MRLLASVGASMGFQMMRSAEFLATTLAQEASLPCVDAAVFFQIGVGCEHLPTIFHAAVERLTYDYEEVRS